MYKSLTKTKHTQSVKQRVASANAIFKHYKKFFFISCKTPSDGSKLFLKANLVDNSL